MSNKHLKPDAHWIDDHHWWYEESSGIIVISDKPEAPDSDCATLTCIPWRSLRAALRRKDKKGKK